MTEKERGHAMLESAKRNLLDMAYVGLTELQEESQIIFEDTFNMNFKVPFEQYEQTRSSKTKDELQSQPDVLDRIRQLNWLDLELYDFAKKLTIKRFEQIKAEKRGEEKTLIDELLPGKDDLLDLL